MRSLYTGVGFASLYDDDERNSFRIRFGLPAALPRRLKAQIKRADKISAWLEAVRIAGFTPSEATRLFGAPSEAMQQLQIRLRPPREARQDYVDRCAALLALC